LICLRATQIPNPFPPGRGKVPRQPKRC